MGGFHLSVFPNFNGMASDGLSGEARSIEAREFAEDYNDTIAYYTKGWARGGP